MIEYKSPEACELEAQFLQIICSSLVGNVNEDFTESEEIQW